jgi:hypothetical protein
MLPMLTTAFRPWLAPPRPLTADDLAAWLNTHPAVYDADPANIAVWPWRTWADPPTDLSALAVWVAEPHDPAQMQGLVGYFFSGAAALGGEWGFDQVLMAPVVGHIYLFWLDGTKSARDDLYSVISDEFAALLRDGSPVRKTNKAGPGTQGTRKWSGLHGPHAVAWR